ncbi:hypothetical protein DPMN_063862 [Dreissena polymorpha]|uniref:Uncharacterized protein n=1 Tax=Dreissena polymorpha TaxID=45954 RepID=A0A9D4HJ00_DREPO|nr:hypothetical protein DPMN_063862 [Dreissena polymorpha]
MTVVQSPNNAWDLLQFFQKKAREVREITTMDSISSLHILNCNHISFIEKQNKGTRAGIVFNSTSYMGIHKANGVPIVNQFKIFVVPWICNEC